MEEFRGGDWLEILRRARLDVGRISEMVWPPTVRSLVSFFVNLLSL